MRVVRAAKTSGALRERLRTQRRAGRRRAPHAHRMRSAPQRGGRGCAGAGKTWVLVSRIVPRCSRAARRTEFLAHHLHRSCCRNAPAPADPAGRVRVRQRRRAAAAAARARAGGSARRARTGNLRGLHLALLQAGRPVQIRTFHSWFAALVAGAPMGVLHGLGLLGHLRAAARRHARHRPGAGGGFCSRSPATPRPSPTTAPWWQRDGRHQAQQALEQALQRAPSSPWPTRTAWWRSPGRRGRGSSLPGVCRAWPSPTTPLSTRRTTCWRQAAKLLGAQTAKKCRSAASALEQALGARDADATTGGACSTEVRTARACRQGSGAGGGHRKRKTACRRVRKAQLQHMTPGLHAGAHGAAAAPLGGRDTPTSSASAPGSSMGDLQRAALALDVRPGAKRLGARAAGRPGAPPVDRRVSGAPTPCSGRPSVPWHVRTARRRARHSGASIAGDAEQSIYRFRWRRAGGVSRPAKAFAQQGLGGELLSLRPHAAQCACGSRRAQHRHARGPSAGEFDGFRPPQHRLPGAGPLSAAASKLPGLPLRGLPPKPAGAAAATVALVEGRAAAEPAQAFAATDDIDTADTTSDSRVHRLGATPCTRSCSRPEYKPENPGVPPGRARWLAQQLAEGGAAPAAGTTGDTDTGNTGTSTSAAPPTAPPGSASTAPSTVPSTALSPGDVMVLARKR